MAMIQYVCKEGERWDNVAYKAYGTIEKTADVIAANPNVLITERLTGGTVLNIDIIEDNNPSINIDNLPPWKQ